MKNNLADTICALATPAGTGAIAIIRISGPEAFTVIQQVFETAKGRKIDFENIKSHTLHFGILTNKETIIDEVLISVFKKPHSYTTEDTVEISCHGSVYIQQQVLELLYGLGARPAQAGEFTMRAFLNGRMDLSQAEAVADLIATQDANVHRIAMQQLRGGFSNEIKKLREALIHFASLIELELDFAEEDVEFANRKELKKLVSGLQFTVSGLLDSFKYGNVLKNGIPVVITGKPNAGKSTLLNTLLNEDRAIVSEIAGTTRDVIEDELVLEGYRFRFADTAGLRKSEDVIEQMGVERTLQHMTNAAVIIYMSDATTFDKETYEADLEAIINNIDFSVQHLLKVMNKTDQVDVKKLQLEGKLADDVIYISAKSKTGIELLKDALLNKINATSTGSETLVINARHAVALQKANEELLNLMDGITNKVTSDLLAFHIRQSLYHLSEITGDIYTDDLLENIFSKFCIGK